MNSVVIDGVIRPVRSGELNSPSGLSTTTVAAAPRMTSTAATLRRMLSFVGPGFMVAVGYMDPGNWATSLSAGSEFGYSLLSVILLSNMMAMLLQAAAVRLGIASGLDLAQSCRRHFSPRVNLALWLLCEVAIVACNVAEVLGMACGLGMLFHIPLTLGVCITALDVMLILRLQRRGARYLEMFIIALVVMIGTCMAAQMWWLQAPVAAIGQGFVPTSQIVTRPEMLYL